MSENKVMKKNALASFLKRKRQFKYRGGMVTKPSAAGIIADIILVIIVTFLALICLMPMWHTLMCSLSDPHTLFSYEGLAFVPVGGITFQGYAQLFKNSGLFTGYLNTIWYTVATTGLGFVLNVLGGYALSRPTKLKKFFMIFIVFTMMFSGGMIPTYIIINALGMNHTPLAIIIPEATMAMYVILGMNAFMSVPESTVEAAKLDGAGHFRIMFQVMLPQCLSLFVITVLNTFVGSWNSWISAQIYVPNHTEFWPLQLWIQRLVDESNNFLQVSNPNYANYLIQHCVVIVAVLPILIAFPFFLKWLERGMVLGGVKE